MTRIIKFRGKAKLDGKWWFGNLVVKDTIGHTQLNDPEYGGCFDIDSNTVGQFTGLHDQNGKEIYEGDIMGLPEQDANGVKYKNRYVRVVEWVNDGFFLVDNCMMGGEVRKYGDRLALEISLKSEYAGIARCFEERGLDYSVVGNIYDNPELLKED